MEEDAQVSGLRSESYLIGERGLIIECGAEKGDGRVCRLRCSFWFLSICSLCR